MALDGGRCNCEQAQFRVVGIPGDPALVHICRFCERVFVYLLSSASNPLPTEVRHD